MNVIIIGAGEVGTFLAERLCSEDHNVTVIDADEQRVRHLGEFLDVLALHGNGATARMQERANIRDVDLLIAVTNDDEVNLVACLTAHYYRVGRKIARISNPDHFGEGGGFTPQALGIDLIIRPEQLCAQMFANLLTNKGMTEMQLFADGKIRLVGLVLEEEHEHLNRPLSELAEEAVFGDSRLVVIHRGEETIIPRGGDVLQAGDEIFLMAPADAPEPFPVGPEAGRKLGTVVIAGGGQMGAELAKTLEAAGVETRIVERSATQAEQLSARLKNAVIFQGDCTNLKTLLNAGLEGADAYVAVTQDDETNILSAILAHQNGARRTMALVSKAEYVPLLATVPGVDVAISPRLTTANAILRLVRRGRIHSVATLRSVNAEVVEFEAIENSKAVSKPLATVNFPRGAVVGAIVRDGLVVPPTGVVRIAPRDHVIVFALAEVIPAVEKFFARKRFTLD